MVVCTPGHDAARAVRPGRTGSGDVSDLRSDCERIPSLGPLGKVPGRARIDAYLVEERYGLVFVFLGDLPGSERPTIMPNNEYG